MTMEPSMNSNLDPQQAYLAQLLAATQSAHRQLNQYGGGGGQMGIEQNTQVIMDGNFDAATGQSGNTNLLQLQQNNILFPNQIQSNNNNSNNNCTTMDPLLPQQSNDQQNNFQFWQAMMMMNNNSNNNNNSAGQTNFNHQMSLASNGCGSANNEAAQQQRLLNQSAAVAAMMSNNNTNNNNTTMNKRTFEDTLERASPVMNTNHFDLLQQQQQHHHLHPAASNLPPILDALQRQHHQQQQVIHQSNTFASIPETPPLPPAPSMVVHHHHKPSTTTITTTTHKSLKSPKKKQDTKWLVSYEQLKTYKTEHGDCIVPRGYALNPRLASWVAEQRKQHKLMRDGKQSSITPRRIELLNGLGFAWNAQEAAWERHMTDLKNFRTEFGDCLVPLSHPHYPKLGLWVKEQRRHYTLMKQGKQSHMTGARARALDELGFCWDTHEAVWGERLRELCQYKGAYGNCVVPTNYSANPKLGTWVHHQRRQYKKYKEGKQCHITEERIRALDSLGFVWYPRERGRGGYDEQQEEDQLLQQPPLTPQPAAAVSSSKSENAPSHVVVGGASDTESDTDLHSSLDLTPSKRQRSG